MFNRKIMREFRVASPLRYAVVLLGGIAVAIASWGTVIAQINNPGVTIGGGAVTFGHCAAMGPGTGQIQDSGANCTAVTPAALTKTDDTNVTLTLTGTPAVALLQSVQIAAGWTGTLGVVRGGTGGGAASGTLLDNITGFASTGLISRTGAGAYSFTTPAAFTKTDDTNVTLTLGGTPATALLQAMSVTAGWTGTLSVARGGTGAGTQSAAAANILPTPTRAGDIVFWNGAAWVTLAGNNSGTQCLQETSAGVPSWGCPTPSLSNTANSLGADVNMNVINTYFIGPTVAQGSTGTWFASGNAVLVDTGATTFDCKLWDGTTVIDSARIAPSAATNWVEFALSGALASPAGNIRIECRSTLTATGKILFNASGNSKDSTLTAFRIQ